jgi:hypothetical protein
LIDLIDDKNFSASDLELLTGMDKVNETKPYIVLMARALHNPLRLPWLLKDICSLCLNEDELHDLRLALIRIQVDAELRMNEDIQKFQQRRYVAQVIEILIFQELMLAPKEIEGDLE